LRLCENARSAMFEVSSATWGAQARTAGGRKRPRLIGTDGRRTILLGTRRILLSLLVVPYCTSRPKLIASAIGEAREPTLSHP
jgi:hypothetical protein